MVQDAINAWNATGVVKLIVIKSPANAYLTIKNGNYGNTSWAGETTTRQSSTGKRSAEILLNNFYDAYLSYQSQVNVAEHELGHAIGLNHIDSQPSVMNSAISPDRSYPIQPIDIETVKAIYREK